MVRRNFVLSTNTLFWQGPLHTHTLFCSHLSRKWKRSQKWWSSFQGIFDMFWIPFNWRHCLKELYLHYRAILLINGEQKNFVCSKVGHYGDPRPLTLIHRACQMNLSTRRWKTPIAFLPAWAKRALLQTGNQAYSDKFCNHFHLQDLHLFYLLYFIFIRM